MSEMVASIERVASVIFHPAIGINKTALAQAQAALRRRILRAFGRRGLLESCDAKEMLVYQHSGFSVDAGVRIEADDRAALERLLPMMWFGGSKPQAAGGV